MSYINIPSLNYNNLQFNITYNNSKPYQNIQVDDNKNVVIKENISIENLSNLNIEEEDDIYISQSLHSYLSFIKKQIDNYNTNNYWDYYKKITNPYEYIHTHVNNKNSSVCKYKPLSRSFFKMIEIINIFNFFDDKNEINSFHLAEGPGGFIEAFNYIRNNPKDKYYGLTLISDDVNVPSWKKSNNYLNNNKNIIIEYGKSKDGDLFLQENLKFCYEKYGNSMNYITADGGFDFSIDFNKQEDLSLKLIFAQIIYAIIMQKKGGHFVIKIFDIFKYKTVELIFLLSNLYENVYIYKPHTSRIANSEKYIVCKYYKNNFINNYEYIFNNYALILENIDSIQTLFNIKIPKLFINKIEEINAIYGQQQIENINTTLNIIREYINLINGYNIDINININSRELKKNIMSYNLSENEENDKSEPINISKKNTLNFENNSDSDEDSYSSNKLDFSVGSPENNTNFLVNEALIKFELDNFINNEAKNKNNITKISVNVNDNSNKNIDKNIINKELYDKLNNKLNILKKINIQKSINWCLKYDLPINKIFTQ
jgi:23S rRNA U2552 (ribose-2'-O)-methylase RlmE/FtsJ